jgi:uncharacterized protein YneF (UPF0154 family)
MAIKLWIKISISLLIILFLVIGFFGGRYYINKISNDNYLKGQENLILQIVKTASECKPIVIPLNEQQNMTLIAMECLK